MWPSWPRRYSSAEGSLIFEDTSNDHVAAPEDGRTPSDTRLSAFRRNNRRRLNRDGQGRKNQYVLLPLLPFQFLAQ